MHSELNLEYMEREENARAGTRPPAEVEQIIMMVRLELYNRGKPCGPKALRLRLHEHHALRPLPSERTIARLVAKHTLSRGRTGHYPEDGPCHPMGEQRSLSTLSPGQSTFVLCEY